jgi:hypothetical protein
MILTYCGVVDSEDGLLLFGDAATLQSWRGSNFDDMGFARSQAVLRKGLPGLQTPILDDEGIIWNMDGPGTVDLFSNEGGDEILLIRVWLDGSESEDKVFAFASIPVDLRNEFAELEITSSFLAILSPTESGNCIRTLDQIQYFLSDHDMMTETSCAILPICNGRYRCFHDKVKTDSGEACRCYIVRSNCIPGQ